LFIALSIPLTQSYGIVGTATSLAVALWIAQPTMLVILSRTLQMSLRSDILTCYRTPALALLVGGAFAACAEAVVVESPINEGWFTPIGFLVGAAAVMLTMPAGREVIQGSRRLLEMPM
jgi:hypothetical protein